MDKPTDYIERAAGEFGTTAVDVARVPQNQDPKTLLFGQPSAPPDTTAEPDEFFKWDAEKEVDGQKGAFYVDVENNGRTERFWGKTRTEVTRNLAEGKKNANKILAEQREANRPRQPDMKLPFDPIQRRQTRTLTPQEVYQITELAQTDPLKAQEMLFEARTGYTMAEVAQSVASNEDTRFKLYAIEVTSEFWDAHKKDFVSNPANTSLIDGWLKDRKLPLTRNNLEIAALELADKLTKPAENPPVAPAQEFTPPPPPVSPPARPAPGVAPTSGTTLTGEEVAVISGQKGSLSDARSVIQDVFRRNRGSR